MKPKNIALGCLVIAILLAINFFVTPIQVMGWAIVIILAAAIVMNIAYHGGKAVYDRMTSVFDD